MRITVNKTGNNQEGFSPDIDLDIYTESWSVTADFGSTMEVEVTKRPEILAKENEALKASSQLVIAEKLLSENLPLDRIEEFAQIFDFPVAGQVYTLNWVLRDRVTNELFRIIQPQVTWEAWWVIADIPAIVTRFRPDAIGEVAWVENLAVVIGEVVTWNGSRWEVLQSHTTQAGWTPNAVPALFRLL